MNNSSHTMTGTEAIAVRNLPKGEYFKLSDKPNAKVWKLEDYDRSERAYWATDCDDISHGKLVKGSRLVYVGFTY